MPSCLSCKVSEPQRNRPSESQMLCKRERELRDRCSGMSCLARPLDMVWLLLLRGSTCWQGLVLGSRCERDATPTFSALSGELISPEDISSRQGLDSPDRTCSSRHWNHACATVLKMSPVGRCGDVGLKTAGSALQSVPALSRL